MLFSVSRKVLRSKAFVKALSFSTKRMASSFTVGRLEPISVDPPKDGVDYSQFIGTHNGHFHCDEAFACGMLQLTDRFKGRPIVRTRDNNVLEKCAIVVDVGGTFDASAQRYDHHQRGFTGVFFSEKTKTKLSSAGLVYKHYGKEIIKNLAEACSSGVDHSDEVIDVVFEKIYTNFVEHIDAIDNGIESFSGDNMVKNYSITTHLSARVGNLNPGWNQDSSVEVEMEQFKKAMKLATTEFASAVESLFLSWLPARSIVEAALSKRLEIDPSGSIVKLEEVCPWKSHLYAFEASGTIEGLKQGDIKYVLYPDSSGNWRIQCVSVEEGSFENRLSLPKPYCGLRDQELSDAWGIPDCIFVHANGFIGGNKTYDGALDMARKSLTNN